MIESRVSGDIVRVAVAVIGRRVGRVAGSRAGRTGVRIAHFRVIVNGAVAPYAVILSFCGRSVFAPDETGE